MFLFFGRVFNFFILSGGQLQVCSGLECYRFGIPEPSSLRYFMAFEATAHFHSVQRPSAQDRLTCGDRKLLRSMWLSAPPPLREVPGGDVRGFSLSENGSLRSWRSFGKNTSLLEHQRVLNTFEYVPSSVPNCLRAASTSGKVYL